MNGIYKDFGKAIHRTIELTRPKENKKAISYPKRHFEKVFNLLYKKHNSYYNEKEKALSKEDLIIAR